MTGPRARWVAAAFAGTAMSCLSGVRVDEREAAAGLTGRLRRAVEEAFAKGQWDDALGACDAVERANPRDCGGRYCELVARTMRVVDGVNGFLVPHSDFVRLLKAVFGLPHLKGELVRAERAADGVIAMQCEYDVASVPLLIGAPADPIVRGDIRGRWTVRDAHVLAATFEGMSYLLETGLARKKRAAPLPVGADAPPLPPRLAAMADHLEAEDVLLAKEPADPAVPKGGWYDRNGNGVVDGGDELLVDIFLPGTTKRVFDFSDAAFVSKRDEPAVPLTPTAELPAAKCGYRTFHVDDLVAGSDVLPTDGMSFSPDGRSIALPLRHGGKFAIFVLDADAKDGEKARRCLTCGQPGNNDGVRWRPGGDALLFVSDRDHPYAVGNDGAGFGQELYAMRPDGSQPTRLTTSHAWATNYHPNWSPDGKRVVWGSTEGRSWDVMVADFVSDASGMRLGPARRVVHDTTWWETHGFSHDGTRVIVTNTASGFLSTDIYAVDVATGRPERLTTSAAWDEHAHVSPDGRKIAWISGRHHPASMRRLAEHYSPAFDFYWIVPGIFFSFEPPDGYETELTLMDADGNDVEALTNDGQIAADNEWSFDGRRIVFRQSDAVTNTNRIRVLTFDDCL